jgi:glycine cleavage system transcriptional repressor
MSKQYVISIMTRDRVGVVADVTTALSALDGNLADLSQTVLCGYFTMILIASFPDHVTPDVLRETLARLDTEAPFEIGIKTPPQPVETEPTAYSEDHFVLTAAGPDKIGLVAAVSSYLRDHKINIDDLSTRVADGQYVMILSINFPPDIDVGEFKRTMQKTMATHGVRLDIQQYGIFRAINEV